jgi:hypothetical protein
MSNTFTFNGSILKAVKDYNNVIKASVVDRRLEYTPNGDMASKFTASRQVTITDPAIQKWVRENLINSTESEFAVNVEGYMTSSFSEKNDKWYENNVVTKLSLV